MSCIELKSCRRVSRGRVACDLCGQRISKGTSYFYAKYLHPGDGFCNWHECPDCEVLSKFWWKNCWDGDDDGIDRDEVVEMCRYVLDWRDGVDDGVSVGFAKACHAFLVRVGLGEFT